MIKRVISGGQTGADQAGWRAASRFNIPTGGYMPAGFLTEDGPRPEFAEMYGAREHHSSKYPPRTRDNVLDCAICLWFGDPNSRGGRLTLKTAQAIGRPELVVERKVWSSPLGLVRWLDGTFEALERIPKGGPGRDGVVMIAGNRESSSPGIGAWVERYLLEVFRLVVDTKEHAS